VIFHEQFSEEHEILWHFGAELDRYSLICFTVFYFTVQIQEHNPTVKRGLPVSYDSDNMWIYNFIYNV